MTYTTEGIKLAVERANASRGDNWYTPGHFAPPMVGTQKALVELATELLATLAKLAASDAVWAEVDRIAVKNRWSASANETFIKIAAIAARHRPEPEVDVLEELMRLPIRTQIVNVDENELGRQSIEIPLELRDRLHAELAKRGLVIVVDGGVK